MPENKKKQKKAGIAFPIILKSIKKEYLCIIILLFCEVSVIQRKKNILAVILLFIFALYYVNMNFFFHIHYINGFVISHSHFHDINHSKKGTHTASEISLINALSSFHSLQASLSFVGIGLFLFTVTTFQIGSEQKPLSLTLFHSYLRGPPALF
jgi:hypothetical protein